MSSLPATGRSTEEAVQAFCNNLNLRMKPQVLEVLVHMLRSEYSPDAILEVLREMKKRKLMMMMRGAAGSE